MKPKTSGHSAKKFEHDISQAKLDYYKKYFWTDYPAQYTHPIEPLSRYLKRTLSTGDRDMHLTSQLHSARLQMKMQRYRLDVSLGDAA